MIIGSQSMTSWEAPPPTFVFPRQRPQLSRQKGVSQILWRRFLLTSDTKVGAGSGGRTSCLLGSDIVAQQDL
jgi:hypothetical protein